MNLTNPSDKQVLFKIKTTAPKKYCVRPNSGLLKPGEYVIISISLQPVDSDAADKNKHKFMVQSVYLPEGANYESQFDQIWKETAPEQLMDSKLKCVFVMPEKDKQPKKPDEASPKEPNQAPSPVLEVPMEIELQELRERERLMRKDILRLKEQLLNKPDNVDNLPVSNKYTPPVSQEYMVILIIVGVVLGILGMILGKFVL